MARLHSQFPSFQTQFSLRRTMRFYHALTIVLIALACIGAIFLYTRLDLNPFHFKNTWTHLIGGWDHWIDFVCFEFSDNLILLLLIFLWNFNAAILATLVYLFLWAVLTAAQFVFFFVWPILLVLALSLVFYFVFWRPHSDDDIHYGLDVVTELVPMLTEQLPDSCHILLCKLIRCGEDYAFHPLILVGPGGVALLRIWSYEISAVKGPYDAERFLLTKKNGKLDATSNPLPFAVSDAETLTRYLFDQGLTTAVTPFQYINIEPEGLQISGLPVFAPSAEDTLPGDNGGKPILLIPALLGALIKAITCEGELTPAQVDRIVDVLTRQ